MSDFRSELAEVIGRIGFSKWGIGDIAGLHSMGEEFPKALSVALAFTPPFVEYDEAAYHEVSAQVRDAAEEKARQLVEFFAERNIRHSTIPGAMKSPETLHAHFPHKLAATRAGLGWIGKSDLLVTPEFGPRVRLATILFDAYVAVDAPVTESRCGSCTVCTDACPAGVVHNTVWAPGMEREELISALDCSKFRDRATETLGRKDSCGFCLLACPHGRT